MDLAPDAVEEALREAGRKSYLVDGPTLSNHVDQLSARYDRARDLTHAQVDLPAWVLASPDLQAPTLEAVSKEQLRTALVLFKLRMLHRNPSQAKLSWILLRAYTRAEERIRCQLLSREATLKMEGMNL